MRTTAQPLALRGRCAAARKQWAGVQGVLLSSGDGQAATEHASAVLEGPGVRQVAAKLCRCLEDAARATSHAGASHNHMLSKALRSACPLLSASHPCADDGHPDMLAVAGLRPLESRDHEPWQNVLRWPWLADAAELARTAISALQSMACWPCDGLADAIERFPLEVSMGRAQTAQDAQNGHHGHGRAVDICCQVSSNFSA